MASPLEQKRDQFNFQLELLDAILYRYRIDKREDIQQKVWEVMNSLEERFANIEGIAREIEEGENSRELEAKKDLDMILEFFGNNLAEVVPPTYREDEKEYTDVETDLDNTETLFETTLEQIRNLHRNYREEER